MNFQPTRTFIFQLGTSHFFYHNGYQYETKPAAQGGRGYAELLFLPTAEGYVKAVYSENLSEHEPAFYKYVYLYKDHLGNTHLSYTLHPRTGKVTILEEDNYYPFGLKHGGYNTTKKDISYLSQVADPTSIMEILPEQVKYKYYYQEQERQDELGLNWDSFKYRNYDYAIGRFMSVDPLAEKYPYNSTYAFQENKMGLGRELEGLELGPKMDVYLANYNAPKHNMTVQEYLDKSSVSNLTTNYYNNLSRNERLVINGTINVISGAIGAAGAAIYIAATDGAGAAFGGAVAFDLCMGQMGIGFAQISDVVTNDQPTDQNLHSKNTLPGLAAGDQNLKSADKIDKAASLVTIPLTGGMNVNPKNFVEAMDVANDTYNVTNNLIIPFVSKVTNTNNNTNNENSSNNIDNNNKDDKKGDTIQQ